MIEELKANGFDDAAEWLDKKLVRERKNNMKKFISLIIVLCLMMGCLAGCSTEAEKVEYNLSQQADWREHMLNTFLAGH